MGVYNREGNTSFVVLAKKSQNSDLAKKRSKIAKGGNFTSKSLGKLARSLLFCLNRPSSGATKQHQPND
jgi:hypothetical protein